jgi:hypothetical protein
VVKKKRLVLNKFTKSLKSCKIFFMDKHVEPLVTNSEEERSFVGKIAILGAVALVGAGIVVGAKSCEESIDNLRQLDSGLTNHLK